MESFEILATKELITSRLALAKFGATQQTMFWTPDMHSAPLRTPPIANGMTATMEALKEILLSTSSSQPEDLSRVRDHQDSPFYIAKMTRPEMIGPQPFTTHPYTSSGVL